MADHLLDHVRPYLDRNLEDRIAFIRAPRWIGHQGAKQALEAHYLAGGRVPLVVQALIAANKAKIKELDWKLATAIDLAGRDVRDDGQVVAGVINGPR